MTHSKTRGAGAWFALAAAVLALAADVIFLIWATAHGGVLPKIWIPLLGTAAAEILLILTDLEYFGIIGSACSAVALFSLLDRSVGSFVDAFQGIVMFGDSTQVGLILLMAGLMAVSMILCVLSCFAKRVKK